MTQSRPKGNFPRQHDPVVQTIPQQNLAQIKQVFTLFDSAGSGKANTKEMRAALLALGQQAIDQAVFRVVDGLVANGTYEITFEQFIDQLIAKTSSRSSRASLEKVFTLFDTEKSGKIALKQLKAICRQLGENIDEAQLKQMIADADQDGDGAVSQEEFYGFMTRIGQH